jgi:alkyl hydroperoxide reductase subunit AhpC
LQSRHDDFNRGGSEVMAISSNSPEDHEKLAKKIGAAFPILSDPSGETFRRYGILHENAIPGFDLPVARPRAPRAFARRAEGFLIQPILKRQVPLHARQALGDRPFLRYECVMRYNGAGPRG